VTTATKHESVSIAGGETQPIRLIREFKLYRQMWRRIWNRRFAEYKAQLAEQRKEAAREVTMPKA
jgi:hypothetical protein